MYITSFAVRTKNIENKPVVNERGVFAPINLPERKFKEAPTFFVDNRPAPKPHFAAVAIQPPAPKPAPAIVQSICTEGTGSGAPTVAASGLTRSRYSLVPVPKLPRVSVAYGYQPFALPGGGRRIALDKEKEKIRESDGDRSGSIGVGLTEKEIDERVGSSSLVPFNPNLIT